MAEEKLSFQWKKLRLNSNFKLPKLIGHRGVKDLKPENTIESISTAFDIGLEDLKKKMQQIVAAQSIE